MSGSLEDAAGLGEASARDERGPIVRAPILRSLLVVLVGVLVGVVLVDYGVASWDRWQRAQDVGATTAYEHLGWTNRPHFENPKFGTRLDRYGMRNAEIEQQAALDELRIAGFGASRLYGAGGAQQDWIWNNLLEQKLAADAPGSVRVLNGGVMGYSTLRACRRAGLLLDAIEPDLVFVLVSPGAQLLLDPSGFDAWTRFGDGTEDVVPADVVEGLPEFALPIVGRAHRFLVQHSGIYARMRAKFQVLGEMDSSLHRWMLSRAENSTQVQAMIDATLVEARALSAQCTERGIRLVFVLLPEIFQCNDQVWAAHLRQHGGQGAPAIGTPRREPLEALEELFHRAGLETWTFWEEVDLMGRERLKYVVSRNDNHWTQPGHDVFAQGLFERLTRDGLLDELLRKRIQNPRSRPFGPSPFAELDVLSISESGQ